MIRLITVTPSYASNVLEVLNLPFGLVQITTEEVETFHIMEEIFIPGAVMQNVETVERSTVSVEVVNVGFPFPSSGMLF